MTPLASRAQNALAKTADHDVGLCCCWKQPQPAEANTSEERFTVVQSSLPGPHRYMLGCTTDGSITARVFVFPAVYTFRFIAWN